MNPSTTLSTMVTAAPSFHPDLLRKRVDGAICGDLRGAYPNIQAPICSGQTSICTFKSGLQGCCDSAGSCRFYNTCNGAYATDKCTGSQCLACSQSAPYCIKYNLYNSQESRGYEAYSCANLQLGSSTIYGVASAVSATLTSSSSSTGSTTRNTASSSTSQSTPSVSPTSEPAVRPHAGTIAGAVVGGLIAVSLLGVGAYFLYRRWRNRDGRGVHQPLPEAQQHYGDTSMANLNPYGRHGAQQRYDDSSVTSLNRPGASHLAPEPQQHYNDRSLNSLHSYDRTHDL